MPRHSANCSASNALTDVTGSAGAQSAQSLPVPGIELPWLVVALVWVWPIRANAWGRLGSALLLAIVIAVSAPMVVRHTNDARLRAAERLRAEETAPGSESTTTVVQWRPVFLAVQAAERAAGQSCRTRRFFSLVRFD